MVPPGESCLLANPRPPGRSPVETLHAAVALGLLLTTLTPTMYSSPRLILFVVTAPASPPEASPTSVISFGSAIGVGWIQGTIAFDMCSI